MALGPASEAFSTLSHAKAKHAQVCVLMCYSSPLFKSCSRLVWFSILAPRFRDLSSHTMNSAGLASPRVVRPSRAVLPHEPCVPQVELSLAPLASWTSRKGDSNIMHRDARIADADQKLNARRAWRTRLVPARRFGAVSVRQILSDGVIDAYRLCCLFSSFPPSALPSFSP